MLVLAPISSAGRGHTISALKARDAAIVAKTRSAVLGLYSLDLRVNAARARLGSLRVQREHLRAERASLTRQAHLAEVDTKLSEARLASRIRYLYDHGSASTLEIFFGATSLDEAMTEIEDIKRVTSLNDDAIVQLRASKRHLLAVSARLASREKMLTAVTERAAATTTSLLDTRSSRAAYVDGLVRERNLTSAALSRAQAEARAAELRSQQLTGSPPAAAVATPVGDVQSIPGARVITVAATGYSLSGHSSSGVPVGFGVAAVDPSVIPLGTHMTIPGYGEAVAADTGGSIRGATIDLWFPSIAAANAWGRRSVTIALH